MSATKVGENTTNISKLLFFTIHLHFITSNQISTYRKLNLPLSRSIFCLLTSRNAKKTQTDQSMPCVFLQETTHKSLKVVSAKSLFSSVYVIGTTCFSECFSFYVTTKRHYFSCKFIVTLRLFYAPFCYFLWNQCFERSLYFMRFLHDNNMMLIPKFQNKAIMFPANFPN